nr:hypothetical protein [Desulfobacula sp.]
MKPHYKPTTPINQAEIIEPEQWQKPLYLEQAQQQAYQIADAEMIHCGKEVNHAI